MIFTAPLLLVGLAGLPVLWWLLRVTPPAPRTQVFPAMGLLLGLRAEEQTSSRTPWWLLLLRMVAAGLVIVGLAGPVLDAAGAMAGGGRLLLVIDDGWASAPDWAVRMAAAGRALDGAERAGVRAVLLTTAGSGAGANGGGELTPEMAVAEVRARLAALRPKPWAPDRGAAAGRLAGVRAGAVVYVADGVAGAGDAAFGEALAAAGPVREVRADPVDVMVLRPPQVEATRLVARVEALPVAVDRAVAVLAQTGDGRTLARASAVLRAGAGAVEAAIALPPEVRNEIARLQLEGAASAGSVVLLDERWRRRPVGLVSEQEGAETPLIGPLFYPRRALAPFTEVRDGGWQALLARPLSMLVLADVPLSGGIGAGEEAAALEKWVERGGVLVRFAGPRMAEAGAAGAGAGGVGLDGVSGEVDPLLPVPLLAGDRQLGGALSWSEPVGLAAFAAGSPFAGLAVPAEVKVSRQVLAEPSAEMAGHVWASLADGTPLVTASVRGAGRVVLFGVTGNADWSNLPLSGLFVEMLRRLVDLSAGVASGGSGGEATVLPPYEALDGFGVLGPPPAAAAAVTSAELDGDGMVVSAVHPPGVYGPASLRRALNLGAAVPALAVAAVVPGASVEALAAGVSEVVLGPPMLALAVLLLAVDLVVSLGLRGVWRAGVGVAVVVLGLGVGGARAAEEDSYPSLAARIAYVQTGDAGVDAISKAGLMGLSTFVNRRTAVTLAEPVGIVPGQDDLSVFPLLYWPLTADTSVSPAGVAALNEFTRLGGVILIDTRDGGSGAGFAPGTEAALRRVSVGLNVPPLTPLTGEHVLARAFYLLQEFPGRFAGETVWVQRDQDRANDSVSSVIIGGHDWAAAWAVDGEGRTPYATVPGGARQRVLAYRFGVNVVMYALTGNYKGDQVHVPAILERLGQ